MREPDRIIRWKTVLSRTGLSRSTIYRKIAEGTFPAQLKISSNGTGWREGPSTIVGTRSSRAATMTAHTVPMSRPLEVERIGSAMRGCGRVVRIERLENKSTGEPHKRVKAAQFCKGRLFPLCNWRRRRSGPRPGWYFIESWTSTLIGRW